MIGIDLVAIPRMARFMERFGERGMSRFLNEDERARASTPRSVAGLWAAKEAVSKALRCGIGSALGFHDIHICKHPSGAPYAKLSKAASARFGIEEVALSITHDGEYAIAVAFCANPSQTPQVRA